jgi:predicted Ser/Thr protein kinase
LPLVKCPTCSREHSGSGRFCPWCAAPLTVTSAETAVMGAVGQALSPANAPSLASSSSVDEGRFLPGTIVAGRYRIAGLLGRGGMGEVYRATDLTLGQAVALKFLPEATARDERALVRFYNEVRMARQVTHPNVCRVYDIGQLNDVPYISMEYVDGEDLASLLRRIGRLPAGKAVEIARRLCAGLAAAHEKGVLHRDLKPANIMIDGRGNVVIMDFGLAGLSDQLQADVHSGTPAYMSPEQLAGTEVTERSDIYALGLVLYELFTGRRAFEAASLIELMQMQERAAPPSITSVAKDLDPAVERVVLRCLERDPARRPSSALAVAAALPGGDPLAAALAAGEMPSPDVVAAAGEMVCHRSWTGIAWLAAALAGVALVGWWGARVNILTRVRLDAPPEALALQSRNLLKSFGYAARPADTHYGLAYNDRFKDYLFARPDLEAAYWKTPSGMPPLVRYWYRESPTPMIAVGSFNTWLGYDDPPFEVPGMVRVRTGPNGELEQLDAVPPETDSSATGSPFDWNRLFAAATLDPSRFQPTEPQWLPMGGWDARAAWTGPAPGLGVPLRVEAAAWRGRPVFFRVLGPWSRPERSPAQGQGSMSPRSMLLYALLLAAIPIAWHHLRAGSADLQGGSKLGLLCFASMACGQMIGSHHTFDHAEFSVFWRVIALAGTNSAIVFLIYIALEPWVRRGWPQTLIPWSRFTTRGIRDPLVGRDLLCGAFFGAVMTFFNFVAIRMQGTQPWVASLPSLVNTRQFLSFVGEVGMDSLFDPVQYLFLLFLCRMVLRRQWIATAACILILAVVIAGGVRSWTAFPIGLAFGSFFAFVMLRFGFLAMIAASICAHLMMAIPRTFDFSLWYAPIGAAPLVIVAIIAIYGFRVAVSGSGNAVPQTDTR